MSRLVGLSPRDLGSCLLTSRAHLLHPFRRPNGLDKGEAGVIGGDRLLQTRRPALPLPQPLKRHAAVGLRYRPVERHPLARPLFERLVIGGDRLLQTRRPAFPLPQTLKRGAADVKGNLKGEFTVSKSSAEGLVHGLDNALGQVAADQADKVRACLQPVRDRLLDVMLPAKQGSAGQTVTAPGGVAAGSIDRSSIHINSQPKTPAPTK